MHPKRHLLFYLLIISFRGLTQQVYNDDATARLYLKFDKRITKQLDLQFVLQNRLENNFSEYSQVGFNPELAYKLGKHFKLLAGYTYALKRKKEGFYLPRHQAYGGFIAKVKMDRWTLLYRNILQGQTSAKYNREKAMRVKYYDRNKLTLKYEINKYLEIYGTGEVNLPTIDMPEYFHVYRWRGGGGVAYNLSKRSYIEGYFLLQRRYKTEFWPSRKFIYGFTYSYDFK